MGRVNNIRQGQPENNTTWLLHTTKKYIIQTWPHIHKIIQLAATGLENKLQYPLFYLLLLCGHHLKTTSSHRAWAPQGFHYENSQLDPLWSERKMSDSLHFSFSHHVLESSALFYIYMKQRLLKVCTYTSAVACSSDVFLFNIHTLVQNCYLKLLQKWTGRNWFLAKRCSSSFPKHYFTALNKYSRAFLNRTCQGPAGRSVFRDVQFKLHCSRCPKLNHKITWMSHIRMSPNGHQE